MKAGDRAGHLKLGYGTITKVPSSEMATVKWDNTPDFWYNAGVNPCTVPKKELTVFTQDKQGDWFTEKLGAIF